MAVLKLRCATDSLVGSESNHNSRREQPYHPTIQIRSLLGNAGHVRRDEFPCRVRHHDGSGTSGERSPRTPHLAKWNANWDSKLAI